MAHGFPALIAAQAAEPGLLWLTGARLFDGTGSPLRDQTAILVRDGIIRRPADARERCPDGARAVDVGGRVLMPGLTDAHTHASGRVPKTVKGMTTGARSNEFGDPEPLQLTEPELAAVTDEAHRLGYRVAAHAEGLDGCVAAIRHGGMPPVLTDLAERNLAEGAATMRAARGAGVKIALGSDMSLAAGLEIQRMVQHGLTPAEVLVAATSTAAQAPVAGRAYGGPGQATWPTPIPIR